MYVRAKDDTVGCRFIFFFAVNLWICRTCTQYDLPRPGTKVRPTAQRICSKGMA